MLLDQETYEVFCGGPVSWLEDKAWRANGIDPATPALFDTAPWLSSSR